MPLVPVPQLMAHAQRNRFAVGYFESWNLESLQGVIDAAEQTRSPVIIGFNGEFLSGPERVPGGQERLTWYAALGRAAADSAAVPVGIIFNECPRDDWVRQAISAGFNLVMPVPEEGESAEGYTCRVRDLVELAHGKGVAVEAELGSLPYGETHNTAEATDPQQAAEFVAATGIDLLAVSVGNVHVLLHGQKALDLDKIGAIHAATAIPLVLHGGTGISSESLRKAIMLGVTKVNYGTVQKLRYLEALRRALSNSVADPHLLLGIGGEADILVAGRRAVCEAVLEKIELLGCRNKADTYG